MTPDVDDDGVLAPDELTLDDEHVDRLAANRYVVRSDRSASSIPARPAAAGATGDVPATDVPSIASGTSAEDALTAVPEPHGVDVTLKTDGELAHHRVTSHDVREVFAELLTWYASQLDDDLTPTEALQVLLATTDLES